MEYDCLELNTDASETINPRISVISDSYEYYIETAWNTTSAALDGVILPEKDHSILPDNFRFTAKFPKLITHDKYLADVEKEVERFLENIIPLEKKTLALLIQLPPSLEIIPGLEALRNLLPLLDDRFRYAVEVRHQSWFQDLAYNFFADNDLCLVWSQLAKIRTPHIVTTETFYMLGLLETEA